MTEQKYYIGDAVRIRPFREIDVKDIGVVSYHGEGYRSHDCYGISESHIDAMSEDPRPLYIVRAERGNGNNTYIYDLSADMSTGSRIAFHWAQGMIEPFCEEPIILPDEDLFAVIFDGGL